MEEQVARFVATEQKQPLPPPPSERGIIGTTRRNLFATPLDSVLSILAGLIIVWGAWNIVNWAWIDATFTGSDREACLGEGGACWAFVGAKFSQFMYGVYPFGARWRIDVSVVMLIVLVAGIAIPRIPFKRINAMLLFAVYPVVTLILLTGGRFSFSGGGVTLLLLIAAAITISDVASRPEIGFGSLMKTAVGLALFGVLALFLSKIVSGASVDFLDLRFSTLTLVAFLASLGSIAVAVLTGFRSQEISRLRLLMPIVAVVLFVFVMTANFGLRPVPTNLWGGLMLTLVVALSGIAASLPLGVILALGRRSDMPAVRLFSVIFIEFWRGVPLITVLFMANFMLPLFLPEGVSFNQLLRALVGVALFSAAYMAEVIRGGLQAIPKGQYEGADAMALTYWQKMRLIILPQALKLVIPGIVNTFIGLFKDTSLVYIIGLADLLGTVRRGFNDPSWITPSTPATGLVFAAFIYWLFCFSMSRYSIYTERRLDTGHTR
ncbi:amino acid ABC transporter permease [Aurantimonas sp. C2-6-R+9]|uniref:amino acid ABC transporter permease n=1 Tax=unclassified Aurantimonas TaxID=2638230 RepID=UPI002E18BBA7|nr:MULTISPECIES: amino acid ABC transporter permease [unclassified Aurantimonas]MEC5291289.1 amino acid ABC transporter permease [Aurantimonas sp. C2-3-R2]MEC5381584.1 amino acid ABC transporter permease [Aurantimonas sp. C2-6-R+9]MEC5412340.1 amino acid ABC transporter permease [Aurantimonas sp. C2-4-R8]